MNWFFNWFQGWRILLLIPIIIVISELINLSGGG
jgi:hypothetical protein